MLIALTLKGYFYVHTGEDLMYKSSNTRPNPILSLGFIFISIFCFHPWNCNNGARDPTLHPSIEITGGWETKGCGGG
jgi:hypothetical protein